MAHNPTDNRPFPAGLTCRTCKRPVSANEPSCPDCHRANRVKCPQCGKMVNNHFPYCEWCASPLGDSLEAPPLSRHGGGGRNRRTVVVGYRPAGRFLRTVVVGGTFIACASFLGWGVFLLHDAMLLLSGKANARLECENIYAQPCVAGTEVRTRASGGEELQLPVHPSPRPSPPNMRAPVPAPALTPAPVPVPAPGSATPIKPAAWRHSPDWYASEGKALLKSLKDFCAGGYRYDKNRVYVFAEKYKAFTSALSQNDPLKSDETFAAVRDAYHAFKETVVWQSGLPHSKFPHVQSSSGEGRWRAEEGWEFVNPGTADLTVRKVLAKWICPQNWYKKECEIISKNMRYYLSGPFACNRRIGDDICRGVRDLEAKIYSGAPDEVDRMYRNLAAAYKQFAAGCQWRQGVKHPTIANVHSGYSKDTWEADAGWVFVNPGTSDLTVRRVPVQIRCDACRGNGYVVQRVRCYSCNGRGRVPNPAAQVGQAVNVVGGLVNAFGGGRRGRHVPRIPQGPSEIRCSSCNGMGSQQQNVRCSRCNGAGTIYR